MIPPEKDEAVRRALREAFGVTEIDGLRRIQGLSSALVFRMVVRGVPYLLRMIMRTDDPACHFACMRAAAGAGLAPRVWYTSVEDRLSITDFVEAAPFLREEALVRMPRALRRLHALPRFPRQNFNTTCTFLLNPGPALDGFLQSFRNAKLLSPLDSDRLFTWLAQAAAAYSPSDADLVSSHNDLFKPDNVLFDGERVWMVDWEAAFLNDRFADLAVVANLVVTNEAEEQVFLREYFGQPPDEDQRTRLFLMQQVSHMFYAMGFLLIGSAGKPVDWSGSVPSLGEFHQRMRDGEVRLEDNATRIAYARAHWERLVENARAARFRDLMRIAGV